MPDLEERGLVEQQGKQQVFDALASVGKALPTAVARHWSTCWRT